MMEKSYEFCPYCASPLKDKEVDHRTRLVCSSCEFIHYMNPTPAAGVVLVEDGRVLLVKRKYEPRPGMWTLPAGFVEADEDIRQCAVREAKEETNLDIEIDRLFNVYSVFDDPRMAVVLILFVGTRIAGELKCGDDASDARFYELDNLPKEIAFRSHQEALRDLKAVHKSGRL